MIRQIVWISDFTGQASSKRGGYDLLGTRRRLVGGEEGADHASPPVAAPIPLSPQEAEFVRRIHRAKLLVFLRQQRHALFCSMLSCLRPRGIYSWSWAFSRSSSSWAQAGLCAENGTDNCLEPR
jgi:hypothetical protein